MIVCESGFTWSAEQRLGWRTGWTRGFLFHFLYEGPVKWLFVRVLGCVSQENAASTAVVSAQDVQSFLRTVVTLWIMQWSHTHTDVSMDMAHIHTRRHAYANPDSCVCVLSCSVSYKHVFKWNHVMWFFFYYTCLSLFDCFSSRINYDDLTFFMTHPERFHSNYDCTTGNDWGYHMMGSTGSNRVD